MLNGDKTWPFAKSSSGLSPLAQQRNLGCHHAQHLYVVTAPALRPSQVSSFANKHASPGRTSDIFRNAMVELPVARLVRSCSRYGCSWYDHESCTERFLYVTNPSSYRARIWQGGDRASVALSRRCVFVTLVGPSCGGEERDTDPTSHQDRLAVWFSLDDCVSLTPTVLCWTSTRQVGRKS